MKLKYKKFKLKNGVRVISVPLKNTGAVTSLVLVGTGSHYETKELSGISHFLEHLFFKGSKKYPNAKKISTILDGIGASYNAFTAEEVTGFYVKSVSKKAELALDVMSDYLKNPLFKTEEIERERGVILEELRMYYDNPQRHVYNIFKKSLYGDQAAGRDIGGDDKSILNIKSAHIKEYFQKQYRGDNVVAVFAGDLSHKESSELAEKFLGDLPSGNAYEKLGVVSPKSEKPITSIQQKESDQTHMVLGFEGIDLNDERRYAADLLSLILGGGMSSRLFTEIRERRGLAYYVSAGASYGTDYGYFTSSAGVNNSKVQEATEVLVKEFKKIKEKVVGTLEIEKAKNHIEGSMMLGLETSNSVAFYVGGQELLENKIMDPAQYIEEIGKVKPKDIRDIAREIFKKEKTRLALVGPYKNNKKLEEILSKL